MGENRSLDEFLGGGVDEDAEDTGNAEEVEEPEDTGKTEEPEDVEDTRDTGNLGKGAEGDPDAADDGTDTVPSADRSRPGRAVAADHDSDRPLATYGWSPDGDDCPVCGATVQRRWRDGDRFVCADCKE
jgi:hypothetical protein